MTLEEKLAAIRPGVRYRVTFEGVASEDVHPNAVQFRTADAWHPIVGAASIVDVEEVPDAYEDAVDKLARLTFAWGRSGADCEYSRGDVRGILDALRADPALAAVALAGEVTS